MRNPINLIRAPILLLVPVGETPALDRSPAMLARLVVLVRMLLAREMQVFGRRGAQVGMGDFAGAAKRELPKWYNVVDILCSLHFLRTW